MRAKIREFIADAVTGVLNRCMLALLPEYRRSWGHALIAEQCEIESRWQRLTWAAGGMLMSFKEFMHSLFSDRITWVAGSAFGIVSALVDLHSSTRWPHILLLCAFALILASWQPRWAWRWISVLGLSLPLVVVVTNNWGPYSTDRFDVFYGLVPSTVGTLAGLALRSFSSWLLHKPVRH
jgi:hypothetical protein